MTDLNRARALTCVATVAALTACPDALAQDGGPPPVSDTRWAVYTACSLTFLAIVVYLIASHRRAAKAAEELAHLERRVAALE